jgi:hypothetical protein
MKYVAIFTVIIIPLILTACGVNEPITPTAATIEKPAASTIAKSSTAAGKATTENYYTMCASEVKLLRPNMLGCINVNRLSNTEVCTGKDNEFCGKDVNALCVQVGKKIKKPYTHGGGLTFSNAQACSQRCVSGNSILQSCIGVASDK